jgi:trimethylamine---corrinoid protein Co-methyltransferase
MRPMKNFYRVLSYNEVEMLHEKALMLLENPGMKIENKTMLEALKKNGAKVDLENEIAQIPSKLIEKFIDIARKDEIERVEKRDKYSNLETAYPDMLTFSWHTPFRDRTPVIQASLGGGAPLYYDHEKKKNRYATEEDFLRTIDLAEAIPEIVTVGNAVHYIKENNGSDVLPKMVAIKGAAAVAKHSSKPGCTSIIDRRQLQYLMELGRIVKGSGKDFIRNPILVNIHDTESPLRVTRPEASIMEEMIKYGLSIYILPMPLAGISTPVYPAAAAIIGAAEILGVWAAVKAVNEECPVEASCIGGVLNPVTGAASFATPETVLIDLAVAQLFREKYGVPCGTGVGVIDAPIPGVLSVYERTFKTMNSALAGEPSFQVGLIGGAVVFSIEQVLLDLDIAAYQEQYMKGIGGDHFTDSLELIRERGIGGLFIDSKHTAKNFRESLAMTRTLNRVKSTSVTWALDNDPVDLAHQKCQALLEDVEPYNIEEDKAKEIDKVVKAAEKELSSVTGAME